MLKRSVGSYASGSLGACASLALAIGAASYPAQAQSQNASPSAAADSNSSADATGLTEIVVTAQFKAANLQETPIAITAEDAAMMEARGHKSLLDVASAAPNVNIRPSTSAFGNAASIFIRGVGQYDPSFALEPGVGIYIDDVYFPTIYGSVFDLLDLDRVEILRGPQGTLAGKNSIGGAIKLYSKKPTGEGGGYVEGSYGNFDQTSLRAGVDFTLVPDRVFVRLAGVYKQRDGYMTRLDFGCAHPGSGVASNPLQTDCKLGTEGGDRFGGVRAALRWTPSDKLEVDITADTSVDDAEPAPTKLTYVLPTTGLQPFVNNADFINYSTYTDPNIPFSVPVTNRVASDGGAATIRYQLAENLALTSITAFRRYDGQSGIDEDGSPLGLQTLYSTVEFKEFTQENRLDGEIGKLDYTTGMYYYHGEGFTGGRVDASTVDFLSDNETPSNSISGFLHTVYHVTDPFSVSAGVRYTHENKKFTYGLKSPTDPTQPAAFVGAIDGSVGRYERSRVDYRLNAQYQWAPTFMTYATASTGFKGGGVNPRPFVPSQVAPFGPETMKAYEVGAKSELFNRTVRLNVSAFYNDYSDIQLTITNGFGGFFLSAIPLNAGDAHVKGVELEGEAHVIDNLAIDASLSYLDFKYVSLTPAAVVSGIGFGMKTPFTPSTQASAGIQYEIPAQVLGGSLTPRLDANYQGHFYTNAANGPFNDTQSRTLVNGRLTWKSDSARWEAALAGSNLLNKYYYLTTFDNTGPGGFANAVPAPPRMWTISIKSTFQP